MTHQQELDDARAEMTWREEQIHGELVAGNDRLAGLLAVPYVAARDRYLALLAEQRIRNLKEVTA